MKADRRRPQKDRLSHPPISHLLTPHPSSLSPLHPPPVLAMPAPPEFLKFIDDNASKFVARLGAAVAIPR